MSLKNNIKQYLWKNSHLSLQDLELLCKQNQKKLSNGERRLRELMDRSKAIMIISGLKGDLWQITKQDWNKIMKRI